MKAIYQKPEIKTVKIQVESMIAQSGPGMSATGASQEAGMDAKVRGSRTSDDFGDLW